jgi:hypothetical protein
MQTTEYKVLIFLSVTLFFVPGFAEPLAAQVPEQKPLQTSDEKPLFFKNGGNTREETAVFKALAWIAKHQLPDGGWNFDHTIGPGEHRNSANPGTLKEARNAATALALLPFLAAGQTHVEGKYKTAIDKGLKYLIAHQQPQETGGSFREQGGSMYSHGLASIALCEAYGMTGDKTLLKPAQSAIDYIVFAQDPEGGGWRYAPRQRGDTSVFGWQFAALRSAELAMLDVPEETFTKATKYLDAAGDDGGTFYGYTVPARGTSTTSIGLLSRMEMGWENDAALKKGMEFIAEVGPSLDKANMYYNFYATQAMFFYSQKTNDDEAWKKWSKNLQTELLKAQAADGPESGSWYFQHALSGSAGRLYDTALAALTLEIYYRYLPRWKAGPQN